MKLYHFIPNRWYKAVDYPVVSDSEENALASLKQFLKMKSNDNKYWLEQYNKWENATVDNLPDSYLLKVSDVIMPMS